jgi:hypothetical protein
MEPGRCALGVILAKLEIIKTFCRRAEDCSTEQDRVGVEQDRQCLAVLTSADMRLLPWNGVTARREKTRLKASDRGKEVVPQDERRFFAQAVNSPMGEWGMRFLYPDDEMRQRMMQAYSVAELLRDMFFIMRNSNHSVVVDGPRNPFAESVRLARECQVQSDALLERGRGKRFMADLYGTCGPNAHADQMAAEAEKDITNAAVLNRAAKVFAELSGEEAGPQQRERAASLRDKWVCDQISRAVARRFGRPLDSVVAQAASMLLGHTISTRVVRTAREGRAHLTALS